MINYDELEEWSHHAAQALQDFCDEAQIAEGDPDGESELQDIRLLLAEHSAIIKGEPLWQKKLNDGSGDADHLKDL